SYANYKNGGGGRHTLQDEFGQVGVQLVLLVDALLLDAVPTFFLVQPLLFCQVSNSLVVVLQLQVTLTQEEVCLNGLAVQLQSMLAVSQSLVILLQLYMAEGPVGVVYNILSATHNSFAVAGCSLLVLAAEEQPVPLLLQLLRGGTLLRAAGHLLHRLRGARLALLPNPVPRLFGWPDVRVQNDQSVLDRALQSRHHRVYCTAAAMRVF
uniref:Uncharacterized protein n=1 Tax=Nothobranchius furzeri TaxID=105023 RepID=A0A8C6LYY9_NOTFU